MVIGVHFLLYSPEPELDRAFLRDVLDFSAVDTGGGWLIMKLPKSEIGVHPLDGESQASIHSMTPVQMFLMTDDLEKEMTKLAQTGVGFTEVHTERWGIHTSFGLPSGLRLGIYQPLHPLALDLA